MAAARVGAARVGPARLGWRGWGLARVRAELELGLGTRCVCGARA